MKKEWVIISLGALVVAVIFFLNFPSLFGFKPYGTCCGGPFGFPLLRICECTGIKYTHELPCCDRGIDFYCIGATKNCRCFNETKARLLLEDKTIDLKEWNGEYHARQAFLDHAYDPCE